MLHPDRIQLAPGNSAVLAETDPDGLKYLSILGEGTLAALWEALSCPNVDPGLAVRGTRAIRRFIGTVAGTDRELLS